MPANEEQQRQAECFCSVYSVPGRYVNDHCFVEADDHTLHLFHIVGPVGKGCYDAGSEVSFGHATSRDLSEWTGHDDTLPADPCLVHERHHVFAPFVCEHDGGYFLFYAGVNQDVRRESMCLARSPDLHRWQKHPYNPIFRPSRHWAEYGQNPVLWGCCRDPHILRHPEFGFILYFVTWLKDTCGQVVAIGAAVSDDLVSWQDAGPVLVRGFASGHSTTSMESPCVVERNGIYHLFYKHREETRLVMSDDPFRFSDKEDRWFSVAHAAEIFQSGESWYISSCSRDTLDVRHERSDRTRGLFLASLDWSDETPTVVPFTPFRQHRPEGRREGQQDESTRSAGAAEA